MNIPAMEKKIILAIINYAKKCEENGNFIESDTALAIATASLNSSMKKVADGGLAYNPSNDQIPKWNTKMLQNRTNRNPDIMKTLQQTFIDPAARSAAMEAMQGNTGQNLGMLANIYGPGMIEGNIDPSSYHIPGTKTTEEGEDTDSDWQPWRTPGSTDERMNNYMNQQQGKSKLVTDIITKLGDWARRVGATQLGLQPGL